MYKQIRSFQVINLGLPGKSNQLLMRREKRNFGQGDKDGLKTVQKELELKEEYKDGKGVIQMQNREKLY